MVVSFGKGQSGFGGLIEDLADPIAGVTKPLDVRLFSTADPNLSISRSGMIGRS